MGGGGSAPKPPKLKKADIPALQAEAASVAKRGYQLSDQDLASRVGPLIGARNVSITDSINQLKGGLPSQATGALATAGLVPESKSITAGGNEFSTARNLGEGILAKEARDRNYFESELQANPERGDLSGISGSGFLKLMLANSGLANQVNQQVFGTQLQSYNTAVAQQGQNYGALTNIIGGLGTDFSKFFQNRPGNEPVYPSTPLGVDPYTNPFVGGAYNQPTQYSSPDMTGWGGG